ncbi:MAG: hypothetical protein AAGJ86_02370 [Pseudomonadota bacterium]
MSYCHSHNLVDDSQIAADKPFGIRVTVPASDPINRLIGQDWHRDHWFQTESDRDGAFREMAKRHGYYRIGDDPSQVLTKISRRVSAS